MEGSCDCEDVGHPPAHAVRGQSLSTSDGRRCQRTVRALVVNPTSMEGRLQDAIDTE